MSKFANTAMAMAGMAALAGFAGDATAKSSQPVLWNGVRVGMSLAEVRTVLPGATVDGETIVGGEAKVAGAKFDSFVETSQGRAVSVKLVGSGYVADDVMAALNTKYGRPVSVYRCQSLACSGSWSAPGGVKITLLRLNGNKGSALIISYQAVDLSNL